MKAVFPAFDVTLLNDPLLELVVPYRSIPDVVEEPVQVKEPVTQLFHVLE